MDGQILRGSVLQTRKEEGPKDHMSFEEAIVAAIDFHGALTGTGSYAPPVAARGGKHKGGGVGPSPAYSYSAQVAEVSVDEDTGRSDGAQDMGGPRLRTRAESGGRRRPGDRLGLDGAWARR